MKDLRDLVQGYFAHQELRFPLEPPSSPRDLRDLTRHAREHVGVDGWSSHSFTHSAPVTNPTVHTH